MTLSWNQITLGTNEEAILEVLWCPFSEISSRYVITIEDCKKIKKDVPVAFKSIDPNVSTNTPEFV